MTSTRCSVVVLGSINHDYHLRVPRLPLPGETVVAADATFGSGGKSANQAVAAAKLGADTALIGAVGDDAAGRLVLDAIRRSSVDVAGVTVMEGTPTGQAIVVVDDAGENSIVVVSGANAFVGTDPLADATKRAGVLVLSLEVAEPVAREAAEYARAEGVRVILNLSPAQPVSRDLLDCVDLLVVNEHELVELVGPGLPWMDDGHRTLDACGVDALVVTLGGRGAAVIERGEPVVHRDGLAVPVVDTTGCGDAFLGALAGELVGEVELPRAVGFAVAAGALAATKPGAQASYPTRAEVEQLLIDH